MKIMVKDLFTIIESEEGMVLIDKDGYSATKIYLGKYDSPDNYTEIPEDEYVDPNPPEPPEEEPEIPEQPPVNPLEDMIQRIFEEEVNK
jgi:cytochrome b involved in lipid metabolism